MPGPHGGVLTVQGLCAYCDTPTTTSCRLCSFPMCPDHADEDDLLCIECSRGRVGEE